MRHSLLGSAAALAVIMAAAPTAVFAQAAQTTQTYDIGTQDLASALRAFSTSSGRELVAASDVVVGKQSQTVRGVYAAEEALNRMLDGTGLVASLVDGAFVIRPARAASGLSSRPERTPPSSDIVVTGTRIRGSAPTGSPVVVVDRDAIDRSGRASVADLLQTIPQNFGGGQNEATQGTSSRNLAGDNASFGSGINLRGLGTASTLTLFDGIRPALAGANGSFSDVSLIPSSALERIEILTDGASAIYGADAVGGVVNFRFRNRFEGFETRLRAATADGDFTDVQLGQLIGKRWGSGGVVVALEFNRRGRLAATDRAFVTEDLRPFGGPDNRSIYAAPGTIVAANGQVFGIPAGQDGTRLTAAQLIPGVANRSDMAKRFDVLPDQESGSGYLSFDQELGSGISLFVRGLYARRVFDKRQLRYGQSAVNVPVTNAFYVDPIGTRQPVTVRYDFQADLGAERLQGSVDAATVFGGLKAQLAGWNIEASATYGSQITLNSQTNIINSARLAAALADSNRATAFNVFGAGGSNSPAVVASVLGSSQSRLQSQVIGQALRVDGTVLDLPTGALKLAFGGERREEKLSYDLNLDRSASRYIGTLAGLPGRRTVTAIYSELLVPVLSGDVFAGFPGKIDLSLAGRVERYSDVGTTSNPKVGVSWQIADGLTLRGSYGTSFRAPFFQDLYGSSQNLYATLTLPDPRAPGGQTNVIGLFGLPDKLGPERARTQTLGFDFRPPFIPGLSLTANWFRVDYRDRIDSASIDLFNYLVRRDVYAGLIIEQPSAALVANYYVDPLFQNFADVPASSIGAIVNGYTLNLARVVLRGVDFDLNYTRGLWGGTATAGLAGTRMLAVDQQVTALAVPINTVGMLGSPSKLRLRGQLGWSDDRISIGAMANYTAGYSNQLVAPAARVSPYLTIDGQIGVTVPTADGPKLWLSLSATNILDRDPPYVVNPTSNSTLGYDPEQASPVGRVISVQAVVSW